MGVTIVESLSLGVIKFMAVGLAIDVVNTKNVSNKNPKSTIGVKSTRVLFLFNFLPCLCFAEVVFSISAMLVIFY